MADDDLQNFPADQGLPADLDTSSPYSGNRPASGARRATPGEVLSQDFQGAQNAGDFLGLDVEFTAGQDPAAAGLDLTPPPTTYDPGQGFAAEPAPLPAGDAAQEFAQAPSAFEFGEDLGSEEGEIALEVPGAQSNKPLLVGALLVAALGAGGYFYGSQLYSRYFSGKEEVAKVGPEASPSRAEKTPAAENAPAPAPSQPAGDETRPAPAGPVAGAKTPAREPAPKAPAPETAPAGPEDSGAFDPAGPAGAASNTASAAGADAEPLFPKPGAQAQGFPDLGGSGYEWATADELEMIWRGSIVPMEAVHAPVRTLMPRVGRVRVFTTSGDVFDGRLYAVGENRVWIDAAPGRIGLDGDRVERIEVLPPDPAGQVTTGEGPLVAGGKRVRVRVPGGMLFGRVLKSEGEDVTLALDDGGRVRVKAASIEELGTGRAIVVRR